MKKYLLIIASCLLTFSLIAKADYCPNNNPEVEEYIQQLVKKYNFDQEKLDKLFCTVTVNEEMMNKLSKPAEAMPWYKYQALLVTPERVEKGLTYWKTHEKILNTTEKKYGVPASVIVAIIGIETKYGENKGSYPVFNTLVNLGFNHGKRANFFRSELTEYLLLARENHLMPLELKGSYAGAVGLPQFMPSSYRNYAIDFSNKGFADLFENDADAIASVGNYLNKHGWKTGEKVLLTATVNGDTEALIAKNNKPRWTEQELAAHGVKAEHSLGSQKTVFVRLEDTDGPIYRLGLHNFYVISTYNNSQLYVMAIDTLAKKIREQKYHPDTKQVAVTKIADVQPEQL